jgi:ERCC4-type nuclease
MGLVQNLKKKFNKWVDVTLAELCSAYIKQLAKQTTKKRNNSLSTECLQNNLTTEHRSTTIVTSSQDTSEKIIMELDKTDQVVAHVREWSIEKVDSDIPMENARAIYEEFEEWIELDEEKGSLDIISLEPFDDQS